MILPVVDVPTIETWAPCHSALVYEDPTFTGNALDVLNYAPTEMINRFWVMLRPAMVPDETVLHDFGVACVEQFTLTAEQQTSLDIKKEWILGNKTDAELDVVIDAEKANLVTIDQETVLARSTFGSDYVGGTTDPTAINAANLKQLAQQILVMALDDDSRTASWGAVSTLLNGDVSYETWAKDKMIELIENA